MCACVCASSIQISALSLLLSAEKQDYDQAVFSSARACARPRHAATIHICMPLFILPVVIVEWFLANSLCKKKSYWDVSRGDTQDRCSEIPFDPICRNTFKTFSSTNMNVSTLYKYKSYIAYPIANYLPKHLQNCSY